MHITKLKTLQNKKFNTSIFMTMVMIFYSFNSENFRILMEPQLYKKNIVASYYEVKIYFIYNATNCVSYQSTIQF